jgi:hypothetical protein
MPWSRFIASRTYAAAAAARASVTHRVVVVRTMPTAPWGPEPPRCGRLCIDGIRSHLATARRAPELAVGLPVEMAPIDLSADCLLVELRPGQEADRVLLRHTCRQAGRQGGRQVAGQPVSRSAG